MRQTKWLNGIPIVVFVLPSKHPQHQLFCKETLHLFPYQLDRIWDKLTFSGLGVAPIEVNNQDELILAVSSTVGAIGFINKDKIVGEVNVIAVID